MSIFIFLPQNIHFVIHIYISILKKQQTNLRNKQTNKTKQESGTYLLAWAIGPLFIARAQGTINIIHTTFL